MWEKSDKPVVSGPQFFCSLIWTYPDDARLLRRVAPRCCAPHFTTRVFGHSAISPFLGGYHSPSCWGSPFKEHSSIWQSKIYFATVGNFRTRVRWYPTGTNEKCGWVGRRSRKLHMHRTDAEGKMTKWGGSKKPSLEIHSLHQVAFACSQWVLCENYHHFRDFFGVKW